MASALANRLKVTIAVTNTELECTSKNIEKNILPNNRQYYPR